jgi:acyl carrier protein
MDREEFRKKVAEILKLSPTTINDDTNLIKDLGIDSLKLLQLVNGIEVCYNVEIDDAQIDKLSNFSDAYAYVKHLVDLKIK